MNAIVLMLISLAIGAPSSGRSVEILSSDPGLLALAPAAAMQGAGVWHSQGYIIATGRSIAVDSLGAAKNRQNEQQIAEQDARSRMLIAAAQEKDPDYEEESFDVVGRIDGFKTAATYHLPDDGDFFLVGVAKSSQVQATATFSPTKARAAAIACFEASRFAEAARRLAALTARGIQDDDTEAFAKAASWQVNLAAGIEGKSRDEALAGLGAFYENRHQYESAIHFLYDLYLRTPQPPRGLLEELAKLSAATGRDNSARAFEAELVTRGFWKPQPATAPAAPTTQRDTVAVSAIPIRDATIEDSSIGRVLRGEALLLRAGGAKVVRTDEGLFFIAIGCTAIHEKTPDENLRQLRVAKINAQREALSFAEKTEVVVEERLNERVTMTNDLGHKTASAERVLEDETRTKLEGSIRSDLRDIGTWRDTDDTLFFWAVGTEARVNNEQPSTLLAPLDSSTDKDEATMQKRKVAIIVYCLALFPAVYRAGAQTTAPTETVEIVALGVGRDEMAATKDALSNAVQQAIGALVSAETLVQNDQVVRDQVLAYSDGFVAKYDVVGNARKRDDGLVAVTIRATVQRSKLLEKVKEAHITVRAVDGQALFGEAVTKEEQRKNGAVLLATEFKDAQQNLIKAEVPDKPTYDEGSHSVRATIIFSIDEQAYAAFTKRAQRALDQIALRSIEIESANECRPHEGEHTVAGVSCITSLDLGLNGKQLREWVGQDSIAALCMRLSHDLSTSKWKVYALDPNAFNAIYGDLHPVTVSIDLIDTSGDVVDGHSLVLNPTLTFEELLNNPANQNKLFISPPIVGQRGQGLAGNRDPDWIMIAPLSGGPPKYLGQWDSMVLPALPKRPLNVAFKVTTDQLRTIAQVRCTVKASSDSIPEPGTSSGTDR